MTKAKDWTGQKFGRLTFVRRADKRVNGKILWEALCDCGNTTYVRPGYVSRGRTSSCGCYRKEYEQQLAARTNPPIISSARAVWRGAYKDDGLSFDSFYLLSQQSCYYCSRLPHRTYNVGKKGKPYRGCSDLQVQCGNFTYNGLDRIDSLKGHTLDNVVPCCTDCNQAKMGKTMQEFIAHIERMYIHTRRLVALSA